MSRTCSRPVALCGSSCGGTRALRIAKRCRNAPRQKQCSCRQLVVRPMGMGPRSLSPYIFKESEGEGERGREREREREREPTIDGDHIAGWATGAPRQRRAEPVAGFVSTTLVSPNASSARRGSAMPAAAGSGAGRMPTAKDVSQAPSASVPAPACANSAPPSASVKADGNSGTVGLAPLARPAAPTGMTSCSNIPALQLMLEPESEPEPGIPFCPVPLMVMEGGGAASGSSDSDSANIPSPQVRAKYNICPMNSGMWT